MLKTSNYQNFGGGGRECESRYQTIRPHLPTDRPCSVLDVGSNMGFFSIAIARDFPAGVVHAIEHKRADCNFHAQQLRRHGLQNNYIYRALLNYDIIRDLFGSGTKCVFDATLLLSVVHHFHYPFEPWAEMVGSFLRHSKLTFIELPSVHDAQDIAAIGKFRAWYAQYAEKPYESLVGSVLSACALDHCQIQTLRTGLQTDSSKDTRHLLLVRNDQVTSEMPRFHTLPIMQTPGIFLFHPNPRPWVQNFQDAKSWTSALPSRVFGRLKRFAHP